MRPDTVAAHCKYVTKRDIALMREGGLTFAHCGETSGKRGALPPMKDVVDGGVRFAFGTDWVTTDPWTNMRITIIADRLLGCTIDDMNARLALRKSTIEPARALGIDSRVGSIEVGKEADIIMLDMAAANLTPVFDDPVATVVYNANRHDVVFAMVQGNILMEDRVFLKQDEKEILRAGQETAAALYRLHRR